MNKTIILALVALGLAGATQTFAAGGVVVQSRKADDSLNSNVWTEVSGAWGKSKNKTRVDEADSLDAKNVSICATNKPAPAFKVSPEGLESGKSYTVEVTFGMSKGNAASTDLVVAVTATGVSACTIPTNTPAFQKPNVNAWATLGTITPNTDHPTLTFTYASGTLSPFSRWYADTIRFTPEGAAVAPKAKPAKKPKKSVE
jgi:hypothetical protein